MQLAQRVQCFWLDGLFKCHTDPDAVGPHPVKEDVERRTLQDTTLADRASVLDQYLCAGLGNVFNDARNHTIDQGEASRQVKPQARSITPPRLRVRRQSWQLLIHELHHRGNWRKYTEGGN